MRMCVKRGEVNPYRVMKYDEDRRTVMARYYARYSVIRRALQLACAVAPVGLAAFAVLPAYQQPPREFAPGQRVLLDAHNAYPESGLWSDRIERAISTGTPLAIEQDLYWREIAPAVFAPVVAHDSEATAGAPTLEKYFFERVRPIMEQALKENRRDSWPLIVLNLDFKTDEREHHEAVRALVAKHSKWMTYVLRSDTPGVPTPLTLGPMLVLCGQDSSQRRDFHDALKVHDTLQVFGAIPVPAPRGSTREARARTLVRMLPEQLVAQRASNYARWVNFSWGAVEEGGQNKAGEFSAGDSVRLLSLVQRGHANNLFVRFYTLDGFSAKQDKGFTASYNFGTERSAAVRWNAVVNAGVDFVATDQYEQFSSALKRTQRRR